LNKRKLSLLIISGKYHFYRLNGNNFTLLLWVFVTLQYNLRMKKLFTLFLLFTYSLTAQITFSKRIHYGVRDNQSQHILLYNDTFYLSTSVGVQNQLEPAPWATSLLRIDLNGDVIPLTLPFLLQFIKICP